MEKRYRIRLFIILSAAVLVHVLLFLYLSHTSEDEKEIHRYWYLCNYGNKYEIDDDSLEGKSSAKPFVGIDINFYGAADVIPSGVEKAPVTIALIDTGVDFGEYPEHQKYLWNNQAEIADDNVDNDNNGFVDDLNGYNFIQNTGDIAGFSNSPSDNNHGTMCAGIIVSIVRLGVTDEFGEHPIQIMVLKVMESKNSIARGNVENVIKAINYAENNGAKICNMSFNLSYYSEKLYETMRDSNMLFVVSTGNGTNRGISIDDCPLYPASYNLDNIISVTNLNYNGKLNKSANYGKETVDIAAPGTSIRGIRADGTKYFDTGSSLSAPMVSSVAALVYMVNPHLSATDVKNVIMKSATSLDDLKQKVASGGMLNAEGAIKRALVTIAN